MITDKNRIFVFIFGCIGLRLLLALIVKNLKSIYLPYLSIISLIPAIGFLLIFVTGSRKTGFEAGGKIWWNYMRPIHSLLYFLFSFYALNQDTNSWKILFLDAILGIFVKVIHILG